MAFNHRPAHTEQTPALKALYERQERERSKAWERDRVERSTAPKPDGRKHRDY